MDYMSFQSKFIVYWVRVIQEWCFFVVAIVCVCVYVCVFKTISFSQWSACEITDFTIVCMCDDLIDCISVCVSDFNWFYYCAFVCVILLCVCAKI